MTEETKKKLLEKLTDKKEGGGIAEVVGKFIVHLMGVVENRDAEHIATTAEEILSEKLKMSELYKRVLEKARKAQIHSSACLSDMPVFNDANEYFCIHGTQAEMNKAANLLEAEYLSGAGATNITVYEPKPAPALNLDFDSMFD